jgi:molybdopterin/thiamine biosynthesis adenylyltransferase
MDTLKGGLNGDFTFKQQLDPETQAGKIVVLGVLSYGAETSQDVLVVFPPTYPRRPPSVRAVSIVRDANGHPINFPPFLFHKGNQYSNGDLCLFRKEVWNSEEHSIGWVLRRAQQWLSAANSSEGFREDQVVEEHLTPLPPAGQILIPRLSSIPQGAKKANIFLKQFKPNYYIIDTNHLPASAFSNHEVSEEVATCYFFPEGLTLKEIFPNAGLNSPYWLNALKNAFLNHFGEDVSSIVNQGLVGIYLPSERTPWHFIRMQGNQRSINFQYFLTRIIESELFLRIANIYNVDVLANKTVTIIGLGALGSEIACELANSGVGIFNLFDYDTFELGNIPRHAADLSFVGELKVEVTKKLILRRNPNTIVNTYPIDALEHTQLLESCIKDSDLVLIMTAEEPVDYFINDVYVPQFDKPFVFARVAKGALTGVAQVVAFKKAACLRCLDLQGAGNFPKTKHDVDSLGELPPEFGSCASPAFPGAGTDSREVSLQVSRVSLQLLLKGQDGFYPALPGYQFYWHGPAGSNSSAPFTWEIKELPTNAQCHICNP